MSNKVSLVIPVYNEEANLDELIDRCLAACRGIGNPFEVILIDDGSTDESGAMIRRFAADHPGEVLGILLSSNYGQHSAIMAGFTEASGEIVVTLDADLQNPPEEIPNLVRKIEEGFDVVGSVRVRRNDSTFRKMASAMVNRIVRACTGVKLRDYGCMLRAYRGHIVRAMLQCPERSTFIPVLATAFARDTTEIEVRHEGRSAGKSKYSVWKLVGLQFDLLTSMTTFPLRILSVLGALISALGIGFGLFLLAMRLVYGPEWAVGGVFTLFAVLFMFVGMQFIAMGLLGEYIGRIYFDVRARPRYFVHRVIGRAEAEDETSPRRSASSRMV